MTDRETLAKALALVAQQDAEVFSALWEALTQYVENGEDYLATCEDPDPAFTQLVDAGRAVQGAFDALVAKAADEPFHPSDPPPDDWDGSDPLG